MTRTAVLSVLVWLVSAATAALAAEERVVKEFHGVAPGKTTETDLRNNAKLGQPAGVVQSSRRKDTTRWQYAIRPWQQVAVVVRSGLVLAIDLVPPAAYEDPNKLAAGLKLGSLEPVGSLPAGADVGQPPEPAWDILQSSEAWVVLLVEREAQQQRVRIMRFYHPRAAGASGDGAESLTKDGQPAEPHASKSTKSAADGQNIVFVSFRDRGDEVELTNPNIYRMDASGDAQTNLTPGDAFDDDPSWSPDGAKIVFVSNRDGNREIYVMGADGSNVTRLAKGPGAAIEPDWCPTGDGIAFVRNDAIWRMDTNGANPQALTSGEGDDKAPLWSPDGRWILFEKWAPRDEQAPQLWKVRRDGSSVKQLTHDRAGALWACWSPDSQWIAYTTGRGQIWKMRADGSAKTQLTDGGPDFRPTWSPDGKSIAFVSERDGNKEIYRMRAGGQDQTNLTRHEATDRQPRWSDDSSRIVFSSARGEKVGIYAMTADGDHITPLSLHADANPDLGPR